MLLSIRPDSKRVKATVVNLYSHFPCNHGNTSCMSKFPHSTILPASNASFKKKIPTHVPFVEVVSSIYLSKWSIELPNTWMYQVTISLRNLVYTFQTSTRLYLHFILVTFFSLFRLLMFHVCVNSFFIASQSYAVVILWTILSIVGIYEIEPVTNWKTTDKASTNTYKSLLFK